MSSQQHLSTPGEEQPAHPETAEEPEGTEGPEGSEKEMLELVVAIDQGTQSTRFVLFDEHARVIAKHQKEVKSIYPQPGWCEQDPWEIFESVEACMAICLAEAKKEYGDVAVRGIGITNQRETTIAWDSVTGEALHNAIVWHDLRTTDVVKSLLEANGGDRDVFRESTGLPLSTYFSAVKLVWLC